MMDSCAKKAAVCSAVSPSAGLQSRDASVERESDVGKARAWLFVSAGLACRLSCNAGQ